MQIQPGGGVKATALLSMRAQAAAPAPMPGGSVLIEWVPLKPELGVSCSWRLLIFAG